MAQESLRFVPDNRLIEVQKEREHFYSRQLLSKQIAELVESEVKAASNAELGLLTEILSIWLTSESHHKQKRRVLQWFYDVGTTAILVELIKSVAAVKQPVTIQAVANQMFAGVKRHCKTKVSWLANYLTKLEGVTACVQIYCLLSPFTSLFDVTITEGENGILIKGNVPLPSNINTKLDDVMHVPPMIVKPKNRSTNSDSPFYCIESKAISDSNGQHSMYLNLEALSMAQATAYRIDPNTFSTPQPLGESENELTAQQEHERVKNHHQKVAEALQVALELFEMDIPFYFARFYDSRGRMYPYAYHLNSNGNDYEKACLLLDKQEVPTGEISLD